MKLIFIGSGSAFTVGGNNYQSNMLFVNETGQRLLIDCGSDARWALNEQHLTSKDIDSLYISHLHADHVGGLEWYAFTRRLDRTCQKPQLFISENLVHELWNNVLSGGLKTIKGEEAVLESYFDVKPVLDYGSFLWSGIEFKLFQTIHAYSGFMLIPCYGLFFTLAGKNILITTDTQFTAPQILSFYEMADLIFHDCETTPFKSNVHAHYDDLRTLDPAIKKKIWLYHYNPGPLPDAKKDGFRGFVLKGQCFDFSNPSTL